MTPSSNRFPMKTLWIAAVALASFVAPVAMGEASAAAEAGDGLRLEAGRVRLLLPPVIYAVPGTESNLYLDNVVLVLDRDDYAFDVVCDKGKQLAERWAFTPEEGDVGEYPLEVAVRDETNAVLARGRSVVRVVPKAVGVERAASLLLIGASLTEYSIYPQELLDLDRADDHLRLRFIGSRGPEDAPPTGELRHEGYRGWTAQAFVESHGPLARSGIHKRPETGSPFVYEAASGGHELDFARYCREFNGGAGPDLIVIHLVPNDIFRSTDETIEGDVEAMLGHYDTLIEAFQGVRSDTRIGVVLTTKASPSQDGFRNYVGNRRQTAWQYRRNIHYALERMVEHYGGREGEHIYLVPAYLNVDTEHHYPTWTSPRNARSTEKVVRVNNGTHPSPEGYHQIADSFYCWIKSVVGTLPNEAGHP